MQCPCQSGEVYDRCCEPLITGVKQAETAEQLMRARYTAHSQVQMDFIEKTHDPKTKKHLDLKDSRDWAETTTWKGLELIETKKGGPDDEVGTVEFKATFETKDGPQEHHEIAQFRKENGVWFYTDSSHPKAQTVVRTEPKIGRNDPCPCGSGKKYKKCCGAA